MIEILYILFTAITWVSFFIGFLNVMYLDKTPRMTLMFLTFILFLFLMLQSFDIQNIDCRSFGEYDNGTATWAYSAEQCHSYSVQDVPLAVVNLMMAMISIVYVLVSAMGWMPDESRARMGLQPA